MPEIENSPVGHIICIGAVYIDTILTVPHFPAEDDKLRAKKITKRRGGNTANTLEVIAQLVQQSSFSHQASPQLHLLSILPDQQSSATDFIQDSLSTVNLATCIFREGHDEPASSYILQNEATLSRTIISANPLPEMTAQEFIIKVEKNTQNWKSGAWFHFEGRIPDITLECARHLRTSILTRSCRISVECEKPERQGMADVALLADVVFYSKLWAEKLGYQDARLFLEAQNNGRIDGILCCTWGSGGAVAVKKTGSNHEEWAHVRAWQPEDRDNDKVVVDTVGAGDTFIAGMLFALAQRSDWPLQKKLGFANELAGRKVFQDGFSGLGIAMS